jgi:hypothetical protein
MLLISFSRLPLISILSGFFYTHVMGDADQLSLPRLVRFPLFPPAPLELDSAAVWALPVIEPIKRNCRKSSHPLRWPTFWVLHVQRTHFDGTRLSIVLPIPCVAHILL